jgi:tyrosine-protein kinase Etk/Wzc
LQAAITVRQVQLAALRDSATEENPDVIRLHSEIDDLQGQLARMQKGSGTQPTMSIPTSKVPEVELEYVRKEREVKYHEALFDMLSRQYEAARLDEARDAPGATGAGRGFVSGCEVLAEADVDYAGAV